MGLLERFFLKGVRADVFVHQFNLLDQTVGKDVRLIVWLDFCFFSKPQLMQ